MPRPGLSEKMMRMDDATWQRHTNPWSGWTRVLILPLFALAVWSRVWLGWWCFVPLALLVVWTVVNPRAFPPPKSIDNWMSKGVLGERIWLARKEVPIPDHHAQMARVLLAVIALGMLPLAWGLYRLDIWSTVAGLLLLMGGKLWFLDRMVWLYEDTQRGD